MSNGDRWDRMILDGSKTERQTRMDLLLHFAALALVENKPLGQDTRLALAESLLRIRDGEDPRLVFGPIKGKRQSPHDRNVTLTRDQVIARQVYYLIVNTGVEHGDLVAAFEYVADLHHKGRRRIETAYYMYKESAEGYWRACQLFPDLKHPFLTEDQIPNLQGFLKKIGR